MLLELFLTFAFIGAFSFGGGYAMLPLIQKEVVLNHHWLTMHQFADILAVAEMTPGPVAINTATFVGFKTAGVWGSVFATFGVVFPSFIIIVSLAGLVLKYKDTPVFQSAFGGLRPVVVALITGAAVLVGKETISSLLPLAFAAVALVLMRWLRIHPVLLIILSGLLGILVF
ncbi:MAG: chromate transporter [Peptococcaceae bacterium]|jgi:chromate transporter|nr:chromate transporter [Peptococcaceae bacterium]MDH7524884.1 chromate transporter [Peptococcaceae bacterium]